MMEAILPTVALTFTRLALLAISAILVSGCATGAYLTVLSQPEGAFITHPGTGVSFGTTPTTVYYESAGLQHEVPALTGPG